MTQIEYYRRLALAELERTLEEAPAGGRADIALDAAIRTAKDLPPRPAGVEPYVRLFPPPPRPPLTEEELARLVGASSARQWAGPISDALEAGGVTDRVEVAHFLAQVLHETGELKWLEELWGPTPAQARYEGRADLGNTVPGDGYRYRGRGLIQLTGRHNYARLGEELGLPLVDDPDLAVEPVVAARVAVAYWLARGIGPLARADDLEGVTRAVNGGLTNLPDRARWLARAKAALDA